MDGHPPIVRSKIAQLTGSENERSAVGSYPGGGLLLDWYICADVNSGRHSSSCAVADGGETRSYDHQVANCLGLFLLPFGRPGLRLLSGVVSYDGDGAETFEPMASAASISMALQEKFEPSQHGKFSILF